MQIQPNQIINATAAYGEVFVGMIDTLNVRSASFDFSAWREQLGDGGTLLVLVQRPGETVPYPAHQVEIEGGVATWIFDETDTALAGYGAVALAYIQNGEYKARSAPFTTCVAKTLGANGVTPPDPFANWYEDMLDASAAAQQAAQDAAASAEAILDMTVSAHAVTGEPTVTKTQESGVVNLDFGIPSGGGGGGGGELTEDVTANLAVGAIQSGTTLAQGTSFTEFAKKLLITEIAPAIGFSISKSGSVKYGSSYLETLTVNVSAMGTAKRIDTIAWYEGNTLMQTDTIGSTAAGSWTYTMPAETADSTTFKAVVTYTKSDNTGAAVTKTASISFYYDKFYGSVDTLTPSEAAVEALSSALATGRGGTYSFTTAASRICYAYPASLGALTSIKDGNGFSLFDSFTRTTQSYTQNGTTVSYYRYVLTDPVTVTGYSVTFA